MTMAPILSIPILGTVFPKDLQPGETWYLPGRLDVWIVLQSTKFSTRTRVTLLVSEMVSPKEGRRKSPVIRSYSYSDTEHITAKLLIRGPL